MGMRRILAVAALLLITGTSAGAAPGVRLGRGYPWGPYPMGYWGSPFGYYGSFFHPGYYGGFPQGPDMGEIQIKGASKDAMVFVDGAYAGDVRKLKSFWLEPGVYQLEVRDGTRKFERKVYVLSGKTLDLKTDLKESGK